MRQEILNVAAVHIKTICKLMDMHSCCVTKELLLLCLCKQEPESMHYGCMKTFLVYLRRRQTVYSVVHNKIVNDLTCHEIACTVVLEKTCNTFCLFTH